MSAPRRWAPAPMFVVVALLLPLGGWSPSIAHATTLGVPTTFPTIQSAVDSANPGDTIRIAPGTYSEQVAIHKDLTLTGSGADSTIIRAPAALVPGQLGTSSIVEIYGGASVTMSRLAISGPGAGTCDAGPLGNGIVVIDGAHLDLSFAAVRHIHDTPLFNCFQSGQGIWIGDPFLSTASATIRHSEISDYGQVGIIVFNEGSTAIIDNNVITGAGLSTVVATSGIEMIFGAAATITHNTVSGNACGSPSLGCGPDFFNEFQVGAIEGGGAGTVISHNLLAGNQVGIYASNSAQISHNVLTDNQYFNIALQDGSFTVSHDRISGGAGGVAVIAAFADAQGVLDHVKIAETSGPSVQTFECCGFTAAAIIHGH